jgi:hypothetical protein
MRTKIKIDLETGLMIDIVHPLEYGEDIIETPCLIPYHLPKWNGTEWVEGATEIPTPTPELPTDEQLLEELSNIVQQLKERGVL